jgi:hypothetical protein
MGRGCRTDRTGGVMNILPLQGVRRMSLETQVLCTFLYNGGGSRYEGPVRHLGLRGSGPGAMLKCPPLLRRS